MLPREHGAYGQAAVPLLTAFAVAGLSTPGVLLAVTVVAGFLAHEPAAILLGLRGSRSRREDGARALVWLSGCTILGGAAAAVALLAMEAAARWSIAVPLAPALLLARLTASGREKSWPGEVTASLAFSGAAVPIAIAGGATVERAAAIAIPLALLFVSSTLAVRSVILRVRGGGDTGAAAATQRAVLLLAAVALGILGAAVARGVLAAAVLVASIPGLLAAVILSLRPPPPTALRSVGWTLVAVSLATAALVIALV